MTRTIRSQSWIATIWNEILFAREFEYETPLTPEEVAGALQQIEDQAHYQYFLSLSRLKYVLHYDAHNDKSGDFCIELETATRDEWWEFDTAMLETSGTIKADAATGLTTVRGHTRFNRQYYVFMILIMFPNFLLAADDSAWLAQVFWLCFTVIFWYVMYRERNRLADKIDTIIMLAKSEPSTMRLTDEDTTSAMVAESESKQYTHYSY